MPRTVHHRLLSIVLVTAFSIPAVAFGQGATPRAAEAPADGLSTQDRDVLAATEQLATEASQALDQWISTQAVSEERLFARFYYPIPKTDPQKFSTAYDSLAERDIVAPEDRALARSPTLQYAIVTDINGYVPAHNTRFARPLTGDAAQDYINNRTKRLLADTASLAAARSEARYLIQRTRTETGDVIYDVSVPVIVRGKHWGCARIGYRRTE